MQDQDYDEMILKIGRFWLSDKVVCDLSFWHLIMSNVLVTRCEHHLARMSLEYIAYSPLFDKCEFGGPIPDYEFRVNEYNDLEAVRLNG